jgi:hypothetical protein
MNHLARYQRFLDLENHLLVVRGGIAPVIAGMHAYHARHAIEPPRTGLEPLVRELLAATALAALSLAERESWGWSLTFEGMDTGFFAGVEPEGMVCVRVREAETSKASVMVQRQKAGLPMTQSHIRPQTASPRGMVEQYFAEAAQTRVRLEIAGDGDGLLLHALPGGHFHAVEAIGSGGLLPHFDSAAAAGRLKELGEVVLFYECRCSDEMILDMILGMPERDREELFGHLPQIGIECPRCGRRYTMARTDLSVH